MNGPLPYIGGKTRLADQLIAWFPPHATYVEPFCGGAHVFFRKNPSPVEILNDLDSELVNFLKICQYHHPELIRALAYTIHGRALREWYLRQDPTQLTDVQRAARFLYLQRTAWGGKVKGQTYNYRPTSPGKINGTTAHRVITETAKRLERVQLENWPYSKILQRYDRPSTLFYCDPPYVGMPFYHFNFGPEEFRTLAADLARLKGKFLLSINDHPLAREVFRAFRIREVNTAYTLTRHVAARELVISNFPLPCGSNT